MKNKAIVVLTKATSWEKCNADYIGVDRGAYLLAKEKTPMVFAVGDFDSVNEEEFALIKQYAKRIIRMNPIKDNSDLEEALSILFEMGYEKAYVYGGLGERLDHELVNERLCLKYPHKLVLLNEKNRIEAFTPGTYVLKKEYPYCSFFTNTEACITLKGMKYPLTKRVINYEDLYTVSNEILDKEGILEIGYGNILAIFSRD